MNKDELLLQKRLIDLSNVADRRNIVTFSDFLNLNELNILHSTPKNLFHCGYRTFGGYDLAERQMVAFLPDALYYEYFYPLQALRICLSAPKFAEKLTHRDYLGSILSLGIERSKIGDILPDEKGCIVFCHETMTDYLIENLIKIKHTMVTVSKEEEQNIKYEPDLENIKGTVPSVRLDTVLSVAYPLSRSRLTSYIEGGQVFVNGKLITNNGFHLKEGDIISVRHMGRIVYNGILSETRKGRYYISVGKYV